jgi:TPR repeat protein
MAQTFSLAEAQAMRQSAFTAYQEALNSKSYGVGSRNLTRQDLADLLANLNYWDAYLAMLTGKGSQIEVRSLFAGRE